MKLLFVHQHLGALGGAEATIHLTARELSRRGYSLALLHGRGTGCNEGAWREVFPSTFPLPQQNAGHAVSAALREFRPDLIYIHNMANLEVLQALVNSGLASVRMVHDHEMYCMRGYKYNYFTRSICTRPASSHCIFPCLAFLGRNRKGQFPLSWVSYLGKRKEIRLNQRFDAFLVYSEYTKQELIRNGFAASRIHCHIPIDCGRNNGSVSSFTRNRILYAGQIIRGKGVDILLKALAKVESPFECLILGDGNHRKRCERLAHRLGLSSRVQFKGFVSREELQKFYLESSVFVLSSVWPEPFGLTGPEAMRYGLPVVAFDAGGIREWLIDGENGYLVPWMDTARFAQRIDRLLGDKDLARRLGRRALELVKEKYKATGQIDHLETLFRSLISPPAGNTSGSPRIEIRGADFPGGCVAGVNTPLQFTQ